MEISKKDLLEAYHSNNLELFKKLLDEYLEEGYGLSFSILACYIMSLIKERRFDEAYKLTKWIENNNQYSSKDYALFCFYLFCFMPKDAERIYKDHNIKIKEKNYLVRTYLLQGKIDEAKKLVDEYIKDDYSFDLIETRRQIDNHLTKNAYIEMAYSSFIDNGKELEPGHIVYLKQAPESFHTIELDEKRSKRPYMIWKIENNKLSLFPVTANTKKKGYKLYAQNYPNSIGDRIIKDNLCFTTKDNVLSVTDKVLDDDLRTVLKNIYYKTYFNSKEAKAANNEFMQEYGKDIKKYDIIKIIDLNTKEKKCFFVLDIEKDFYTVIEVSNDNYQVISDKTERFQKDRLIYGVTNLSSEEIETIIKQINPKLLTKSLTGKKINTIEGRYIVLDDNENYCICINELYSPFYLSLVPIKKKDIINVIGEVSHEKLDNIKTLVEQNSNYNLKTYIKKYK